MTMYEQDSKLYQVFDDKRIVYIFDETLGNFVESSTEPSIATRGTILSESEAARRVSREQLRALSRCIVRIRAADGLSAESIYSLTGFNGTPTDDRTGYVFTPAPFGATEARLECGDSRTLLELEFAATNINRSDLVSVFGEAQDLPPTGGPSGIRFNVAFDVSLPNSRRACDLFAHFEHWPGPESNVYELVLRLEELTEEFA